MEVASTMASHNQPRRYERWNIVTQAAEKWGISTRRVRLLCANGEIDGVIRKGKLYMISAETEKPLDKRKLPNKKNAADLQIY